MYWCVKVGQTGTDWRPALGVPCQSHEWPGLGSSGPVTPKGTETDLENEQMNENRIKYPPILVFFNILVSHHFLFIFYWELNIVYVYQTTDYDSCSD